MSKMGPPKPKLGTKVLQESSMKKKSSGASLKRILMLRRRISDLLNDKESWEGKNRELLESLNREKSLNADLQKDVFNWQRLYHEAIISQNTYKVRRSESMQNLSMCLKDLKSARPTFESLSKKICRNQLRLSNLLNSAHTQGTENHLPRAFGDGRQLNDLSNKCEKRMKHKVGPMVKGVLIQKPTIRLERVMLHQPQNQEHSSNNHTAEGGNALTPIAEENDEEANVHLEQISMRRRRKHRLGTGDRWRMRKQERERDSQLRSVTESSDSDDQLGPVIRLQRVSSLLLRPNLMTVDRGQASDEKGDTSRSSESEARPQRTGEDPLEGCSWMNKNPAHSKMTKGAEKRTAETLGSSNSSDEESNSLNFAAQKNVRTSLSDSLYKNKTFSVQRKTSSNSSTADTSHDASDSNKVEPDSTNNIDDLVFVRPSSVKDSLGSSTAHSDSMPEVNRQESAENVRTTSAVASLAAVDPVESSQERRHSSSFCNTCSLIRSPELLGKRIRKPKNHLYPGEEPRISLSEAIVSKAKKGKSAMSSSRTGRKSLDRRSPKQSLVVPIASSTPCKFAGNNQSSQGRPSGSVQMKSKRGRPKKSLMETNSVEIAHTSVDQRPSVDKVSEERSGRNSRRKNPISYKEPPGNVKMRRLN